MGKTLQMPWRPQRQSVAADADAGDSLDGPNKLASFKFFADPDHVVSSACEGEKRPKAAVKRQSASQIKKEKELKLARRSSEMDEMLMKMGLLFPHDLDHAKFPKDHLQVSNDITKLIKYAGVYFQEPREGMIKSIPRSLCVAPLEGHCNEQHGEKSSTFQKVIIVTKPISFVIVREEPYSKHDFARWLQVQQLH